MTADDDAFLFTVRDYLVRENLVNLVGIQFLTGNSFEDRNKFILSDQYGTIIINTNKTNTSIPRRITGWALERVIDSIIQLKGNEIYTATRKEPYTVFINGKADPAVSSGINAEGNINEKVIIDILHREGIIY